MNRKKKPIKKSKNSSSCDSQDPKLFNIDDFADGGEENDSIQIQLSSKNITVNIFQLYKYSKLAQEKYKIREAPQQISNDIHNFQTKYKIEDESIEIFFKMIQEINVEISIDQYIDLCKLSEIFKVNPIKKFLKIFLKQHSENISFILKLMKEEETAAAENSNGNSDVSDPISSTKKVTKEMEDCLINNIDECLQNANFENLSFLTIYGIIDRSDKKKITSNFLFDFIFKMIDERFTLFHFLDIETLSKDRFERLYQDFQTRQNSQSIRYYEYLTFDFSYVKTLFETNQRLADEIQKLQELNEVNEKELKKERSEGDSNNSKQKNVIKQLKKEKNQKENEFKSLKKQNTELKNEQLELIHYNEIYKANIKKFGEFIEKKDKKDENQETKESPPKTVINDYYSSFNSNYGYSNYGYSNYGYSNYGNSNDYVEYVSFIIKN